MRYPILIACAMIAWQAMDARAESLKVEFVAIVDFVDDTVCQCIPSDAITYGDTLVGSYIYDLSAVDSDPSQYVGEYLHTMSPNGIYVKKDAYNFETNPDSVYFRVTVEDSSTSGALHDAFDLESWSNETDPFYGPGPLELISIRFRDNTETALDGDALPTDAPDLASWGDARVLTIWGSFFDYRIVATIVLVESVTTGIVNGRVQASELQQNYPNPFNPTTTIRFVLAQPGHVQLAIYDVNGRLVKTLISGDRNAGPFKVMWDGLDKGGRPVASGVYFYMLVAPDVTTSRTMVLLR